MNKSTAIKIPKGQLLITAFGVDPGPGAVEFAMRYVKEMTLAYVEPLCKALVDGFFEEYGDERVRRCQHCGYFYRDKTKNNKSLTCSRECKTEKDKILRDYRRYLRSKDKPKRPSYKDLYYSYENFFWASPCDYHMREYERKHVKADSYGDNFEAIIGRDTRRRAMGGKKKVGQAIPYNGDEKVRPFAVRLSMAEQPSGKVKTIKRSAAEIEADLQARHGAEKLRQERRRATTLRRF